MDGILIIDKPSGLTSHDVCQRIKYVLRCQRVGHTGTLDPLATGVLPILLNGATKWAPQFAQDDKEYLVTAQFGTSTTTYDREGEIIAIHPVPPDLIGHVGAALPQFRGVLQQVPPPFSAVKFRGKPLYWWARRGEEVVVASRCVEVRSFEMVYDMTGGAKDWGLEVGVSLAPSPSSLIPFHVVSSKGTFVRSLIHDLGQVVGCGAHVNELRRVRSGRFTVDDAHPLETICGAMPPSRGFENFFTRKVTAW